MKKNKWLLIIIVVSIILTFGLSYAFRVTLNSYTDNNFKVEYDSTWKVVNDTNENIRKLIVYCISNVKS